MKPHWSLNIIAESAVLCCSQQNRDLLDLHIVVTDFYLFNPPGQLNFKSSPSHSSTDGDWRRIRRNACCLGNRQQPGCLLLILLSFHADNLGCNSVGTASETNVTTMLKSFATMVCHNIAHDILMNHQFRRLQIWLLQLHIRKQMVIGGEFGAMLAVWDIASNKVACIVLVIVSCL